jgi:uncharacterized protein
MIVRFLRFLLLVGLGYFLYKWLWKGGSLWSFGSKKKQRDEAAATPNSPPQIIAEMKKDPVCGTYIPENQAVRCEFQGVAHYFCSEECKLKFQELDSA